MYNYYGEKMKATVFKCLEKKQVFVAIKFYDQFSCNIIFFTLIQTLDSFQVRSPILLTE